MLYKRILIIFLFLVACTKSYSTVFVVTSNADSGAGTLRDALTQAAANGSATQDIIQFNISDLSVAGRTITLNTLLPDISPNLVIDGTTQPGSVFGVSNSKVKIVGTTTSLNPASIYVLRGNNVGDVTIAGLWISSNYIYYQNEHIIDITNAGTININHCLIQDGEVYADNCTLFTFTSNMIGYLSDGTTGFASTVEVDDAITTTIGGAAAEGNLMSGSLLIQNLNLTVDWNFTITNNLMGTDYTGTSSSVNLSNTGTRISVTSGNYQGNFANIQPMHGVITGNVLVNFGAVGIFAEGIGNVSILGNYIGTNPAGTDFRPYELSYILADYATTAIWLNPGINAIIGGSGPTDPNTIAYVDNGILEQKANTVTISRNSIYCLRPYFYNIHDFVTQAYTKPLPVVQINSSTANTISGTATPGAVIELFSNNEGTCPTCDPRHFFFTTTANNQGNWSYTGPVPTSVVASALANGQTSLFTVAKIDSLNLKVTQPKCGDNSASITGMKLYNAIGAQWIDQNNNVISNSLDISNLPPGKYQLKIGSGVCGATSNWIQIIDNSLVVDTSNMKINPTSCGLSSGYIWGIKVNVPAVLTWTGAGLSGTVYGTEISNIPAGTYTFTFTTLDGSCSKTLPPLIVKNLSGPNIDQSHVAIQSTNCGQSTGSITNLLVTGTGNLTYSWSNNQQQQVGSGKDLLNQPSGLYFLKVTDNSQCGPIYTTAINIPETNGITLDESKAQTTISSCSMDNGSVTGILANGASQYQWVDANNKIVATTPDLQNAAPGDYILTVSNTSGCSNTSQAYHVGKTAATQFPDYGIAIVSPCFAESNGSISVNTDGLVKSIRWLNSQGQTIGASSPLKNIPAGSYQLYLTDQNGCENFYKNYTVTEFGEYTVSGYGQVTNDQCGLKTGSISATTITGGVPPYTYKWLNSNGAQLSATSAISNLAAGVYTLNVVDTRCGDVDIAYTVYEQDEYITAPSVSNVQLCSSGNALITVNDATASNVYRLYDSPNSTQPLDEQKGGRFTVAVTGNEKLYISILNGTCESSRSEIDVSVGLSVKDIDNAFTPNGDGINDYWKINGINNYPNATVQVFNRYGQKVFDSKGYSSPFDGTFNGKKLPAAVYYFIINLEGKCNLLSGSLTIIR